MSTKTVASPSLPLAGFIITLFGALFFSTKAIIVKVAFAETAADAVTLLALRMLFALPFYVVAYILVSLKSTYPLTRRQWWYTALIGACGYYLSSLLDFLGLQYISAGLERLILFLYPTFAVLLNAALFKQRVTRSQRIALLLTYAGIGLAYYGELQLDVAQADLAWGSFLVFLCAVTYSFYIVGSGKLVPQVGANRFTALAMLAATVGVLGHFFIAKQEIVMLLQQDYWIYGILLAVVATVVPSFLISSGLRRIGTNNVAVISGIGPVSTIMQAHYVLGEPVFLQQVAGTVLVIAGILILSWRR